MTIHKALELARRCDYAHEAAEQQTNPINWTDAAAFFLEGYQRQQRDLAAARARIKELEIALRTALSAYDAAIDGEEEGPLADEVVDRFWKLLDAVSSAKGGSDGAYGSQQRELDAARARIKVLEAMLKDSVDAIQFYNLNKGTVGIEIVNRISEILDNALSAKGGSDGTNDV